MKKTNSVLCSCPSCQSPMQVVALGCSDCDLILKGQFHSHPLMKLDEEMLHFLHIFIACEGKISDMEKALGISYPTVKNKIQKLKESVSVSDFVDKSDSVPDLQLESKSVIEILELMNKGLVNYEKGLSLIKQKTEKKK
jgi:hypothetical protein